jgi:hypothetical protein
MIEKTENMLRYEKAQQELLSIAHMNYVDQTIFSSDPTWLKPVPCIDRMRGELKIGYRQYVKEEFIDQCKTNPEFSKKWGLRIEERELSTLERMEYYGKHYMKEGEAKSFDDLLKVNYVGLNIPTKLITITYNDKTIESYE